MAEPSAIGWRKPTPNASAVRWSCALCRRELKKSMENTDNIQLPGTPPVALQRACHASRPGCIKTVELWEASCDKCAWTQLAPNYDEASIHLTCHLDTAHKGWDNEARHNACLSGGAVKR